MKRIISLTITLCLVLGSFSFCFADFTSTDSSNLSDIKSRVNQIWSAMPTYTQINGISSSLTTISNTLSNIYSRLAYGNHSIADLVDSILSWMNPIYLRLQDVLQAITDPAVNALTGLLGYPTTDSSTGVTSYTSYLRELWLGNTNTPITIYPLTLDSGQNIIFGTPYNVNNVNTATQLQNYFLEWAIAHWNNRFQYYNERILSGETNNQTYTDPLTLNSSTFTPDSMTNGLYTWLSKIQNPVARLSYVLASDERIEAQEAAAANEEAVVDNFIDSTGSGSVGVSDFGSLSHASGEIKSNFNTGQSAAGIFNVFDDSHFLYLSQSAADQLDTTRSNNLLLRSSGNNYDTPVLDRYYKELEKILEVNKDD